MTTHQRPNRLHSQLNSPTKFKLVFGYHRTQEIYIFFYKKKKTVVFPYNVTYFKKQNPTPTMLVMKKKRKKMHELVFPVPEVRLLHTRLEMCSFQLFTQNDYRSECKNLLMTEGGPPPVKR